MCLEHCFPCRHVYDLPTTKLNTVPAELFAACLPVLWTRRCARKSQRQCCLFTRVLNLSGSGFLHTPLEMPQDNFGVSGMRPFHVRSWIFLIKAYSTDTVLEHFHYGYCAHLIYVMPLNYFITLPVGTQWNVFFVIYKVNYTPTTCASTAWWHDFHSLLSSYS